MKHSFGKIRELAPALAGVALLAAAAAPANATNEGYATLRATISPNATVLNSNGLVNATVGAVGVKVLTFTRDISTCSVTVSGLGGNAVLAIGNISGSKLTVRTFGLDGVLVNRAFAVIVECGP